MTLIVRELGGGAWSQRASIALLLERALSISVAQRPTLSVTGDRQLPSVQLGLAAELEARRQSRGEICPHGSEAGISGEVDLLLGDRKSTRLNSSHVAISYAVFCLKKKNKKNGSVVQPKEHCKWSDQAYD